MLESQNFYSYYKYIPVSCTHHTYLPTIWSVVCIITIITIKFIYIELKRYVYFLHNNCNNNCLTNWLIDEYKKKELLWNYKHEKSYNARTWWNRDLRHKTNRYICYCFNITNVQNSYYGNKTDKTKEELSGLME